MGRTRLHAALQRKILICIVFRLTSVALVLIVGLGKGYMSGNGLRGAGSTNAVRWHLGAGRPVYYRKPGTPKGLLLKEYPDGRIELVKFNLERDHVVAVLDSDTEQARTNSSDKLPFELGFGR